MHEQLEPDYFGHFDDLRWALSLPDIEAALKRERAGTGADLVREWESLPSGWQIDPDTTGPYWLVSSLGFCRLYDTALPPDVAPAFQGPLPAEVTASALRGLIQALEHLAIEAKELPERFDDAEAVEDVALCTSILHQLMQTWAAFIAVNDNYQDYLNAGGSPSGKFGTLMHDVLNRFAVVDDVTQCDDQMRLLAVATELPLLESWRNMLRGPFKETLPWWLDGTLEILAAGYVDFEPALRELFDPENGNQELGELLVQRNEEINTAESAYALAASARDAKAGAEDELLKTSWEIADDRRVPVRFQLDEAGSRRQLKLLLGGPSEPWQEYTSAQVVFRDGRLHTSSFALGVATFEVESTEIRAPLRAAVVNRRGDRRCIVSREDRNGGRKT